MATVINTTNVGLSELETAPGGGTTPVFFTTSGRRSWAQGVRGSNAVSYFTWGYGDGAGTGNADPIYGLTPPTTGSNPPLEISDWGGLQYWFDGAPNFDITLKYNNTLAPNPPGDNIDFQITIADSTGNYSIFDGSSPPNFFINFNSLPGSSQAQTTIPGFQADQYVLAKNLYWYMEINAGQDFPGGNVDFSINGVQVFFETFPGGSFTELRDWTDGIAGITNATGCDLEFTIS